MKFRVLTLALFLLACGSNLIAQEKKQVEPADLVNLKQVSDPEISPDGTMVAYVVVTPMPAGQHRNAHIWMVPADGSAEARIFAYSSASDTSPKWSPDGKSLAFLSDRENPLHGDSAFRFKIGGAEDRKDLASDDKKEGQDREGHDASKSKPTEQIWTLSLNGGEASALTDISGGVKKFKWSKDGKRIAFIRQDQETKEERERKERKNDEIEVDRNYKYDRLYVYDVAKREAALVTKMDRNVDDFEWSPDGSKFLARISPTPRIDDYWRVSKIEVLNATTGITEKVLSEAAAPSPMRWSPDGHRAAFEKASPHNITGVPLLYDMDSGREILVGPSPKVTVGVVEWDRDGKTLTGSAVEGVEDIFIRIDANTGALTKLTGFFGPSGWFGPFTRSDDQHKRAYLRETPERPNEVYVLADGREKILTNTNPQVATWKLGSEKAVTWKSSKDQRTIYGLVLLPPDFDKGRKYKTIVHAHGGPEEAWESGFHGHWYDWGSILASHGYVVLLPNPRGSDGQGPEFTEANYRDWCGGDFQDVMDGVDYLVSQGIADKDRLGVGGWSYGGYMTTCIITHSDRFKAAVAGAAVTDLFTMATTTDISPSYLDGYFGSLAPNRRLYDEHSPVRYLDHCRTPVLVIHGESDVRVPISQGEEFYNGLKFLGCETEMVRYPREPHIFTEREHQQESLERMLRWYDTRIPR
jgi:dipeptidyl aminopeptidase/acylaminoacyl peptidase